MRLTWSGFKPIVRLLLQPDRAWTANCDYGTERRTAVYYLPDASDALLLEATLQCSGSGHRQADSKKANLALRNREINVSLELLLEFVFPAQMNTFAERSKLPCSLGTHITVCWYTVSLSQVMVHGGGQSVTNKSDVSTLCTNLRHAASEQIRYTNTLVPVHFFHFPLRGDNCSVTYPTSSFYFSSLIQSIWESVYREDELVSRCGDRGYFQMHILAVECW